MQTWLSLKCESSSPGVCRRGGLPSGDGRLSFLSSTSCSISFFRSSWSMAVESKASLTNSDTPGLVDISSSSSRCGWESQRRTRSWLPWGFNICTPSVSHLLDVTDGNWRSFGPDFVCKSRQSRVQLAQRRVLNSETSDWSQISLAVRRTLGLHQKSINTAQYGQQRRETNNTDNYLQGQCETATSPGKCYSCIRLANLK